MNQFKKAKQLKNETGQSIESITDLKTAGVSQKSNNLESSAISELPANQTLNNSIKMDDFRSDVSSTSTQLIQNNTSIVPSTTDSIIVEEKEQIIVPSKSRPNFAVSPQNNITSDTFSTNISEMIEPTTKPGNITEQENSNIITNEVLSPIYPNQLEDKTDASAIIVQPHNVPQQPQETTVTKHNKSSKKSVPNIFSPKGEAKSMRKSLILKPSSVKIAEDYCVKNGGSFNELIQTLLDNFINEYGL